MKIDRVGEVIEQEDGRLLIQYWVISGLEHPLCDDDIPVLVKIAKEHGTYRPYPRPLDILELRPLLDIRRKYESGYFQLQNQN